MRRSERIEARETECGQKLGGCNGKISREKVGNLLCHIFEKNLRKARSYSFFSSSRTLSSRFFKPLVLFYVFVKYDS